MTREKSWRSAPWHHYGPYKKKKKKIKWKTSKLYIRSENMNSRPAINIDYGKRDKLQDAYIVVKLKFPPRKDRRDIIAILSLYYQTQNLSPFF